MNTSRTSSTATIAALILGAAALFSSSTCVARGKPGPMPPPPSPTYPPARFWHNITANGSPNATTSRIYMQGGTAGHTGYLNDLWYYQVASGQWTLLSHAGRTWPELGRGDGAISCGAGKCVLFGGTLSTKTVNETWYFAEPIGTGTTVTWSRTSCKTPGSCPSVRVLSLMAFDPTHGYHVMVGGYNQGPYGLSDTWTFDGTRWTLRDAGSSVPARHQGSATFVPTHLSNGTLVTIDKVVIFGGNPYPNDPYPDALCDLWAWNGSAWEAIAATGDAPCLVGAAMAWYTPVSGNPQLMVTGGFPSAANDAPNTDTWYFTFTGPNSGTWSKASTTACAPIAYARGAYDAPSRKMVFFGGDVGQGYASDATLVCP